MAPPETTRGSVQQKAAGRRKEAGTIRRHTHNLVTPNNTRSEVIIKNKGADNIEDKLNLKV
jgi:hypothetical protein